MKTIMQITWALISLGIILNGIYAQTSESTSQMNTTINSTTNATSTVPDANALGGGFVPTQKDNTSATNTYSTPPPTVTPAVTMKNMLTTVTPVPKTTDAGATNAGSASTGASHDTKSSSKATTTLDDHNNEQITVKAPPLGLMTIKPSIAIPNPASTLAATPGPVVAVTSKALPVDTTNPTSTGSETPSIDILYTSRAASSPDLPPLTGTSAPGATVPSVTTESIPEDIFHGTTTTPIPPTTPTIPTIIPTAPTIQTTVLPIVNNKFKRFSLSKGKEKDEDRKDLTAVCQRLMLDMKNASCTIIWQMDTDVPKFTSVEVVGEVDISTAHRYLEEATKKSGDNTTLIAILASCGALLAMIVGLAIYASHYRKPYNETQQHLTEELQTVENGYHDNPTLEVMEVQPEMQEKKVALNGEFNDSWIVPIDNLLKEDIPDEEDTHL